MTTSPEPIALWALTPGGARLASRLAQEWPAASLHLSKRMAGPHPGAQCFDKLGSALAACFTDYRAHVFFMATGIVVRSIAPHLDHKTRDPAVVVVDDRANWAISLVSGHLGGANRLAAEVADCLGAQAVVTTATDVNARPAIDLVVQELGHSIENPAAIKAVNMALLTDVQIYGHDPYDLVRPRLPQVASVPMQDEAQRPAFGSTPGIFVGDQVMELPPQVLVVRPRTLVAGMGCNRNTAKAELRELLETALAAHALSPLSLAAIASVDLKADEAGLIELAHDMGLPLVCHARADLAKITHPPSPSAVVQKHIGVPSVCEAAALTSAPRGALIVPKMKTPNATVAIARRLLAPPASTSSASAPAT